MHHGTYASAYEARFQPPREPTRVNAPTTMDNNSDINHTTIWIGITAVAMKVADWLYKKWNLRESVKSEIKGEVLLVITGLQSQVTLMGGEVTRLQYENGALNLLCRQQQDELAKLNGLHGLKPSPTVLDKPSVLDTPAILPEPPK